MSFNYVYTSQNKNRNKSLIKLGMDFYYFTFLNVLRRLSGSHFFKNEVVRKRGSMMREGYSGLHICTIEFAFSWSEGCVCMFTERRIINISNLGISHTISLFPTQLFFCYFYHLSRQKIIYMKMKLESSWPTMFFSAVTGPTTHLWIIESWKHS